MPIYEYVCQACQQEQEQLVRGDSIPHCEACGSENLQKLLSVPATHSISSAQGISSAKGISTDSGPPSGSCGSGCGCFPG